MMFDVVWTYEAIATFEANIEYLEKKWSRKEIVRFIQKSEVAINLIEKNPLLFPASKRRLQIRKVLIVKQITLYYQIDSNKNCIYLLTFWNNFQNPKKLKY